MMKFAWAFPLRKAMSRTLLVELSEEEWRAYKAPFGSMKLESAIMSFPGLLGLTPDNPSARENREAMAKLKQFEKPFLTIFGAKDPMSRGSNGLARRFRVPRGKTIKSIRTLGISFRRMLPRLWFAISWPSWRVQRLKSRPTIVLTVAVLVSVRSNQLLRVG